MTVAGLFAGVGGIELGLSRAGHSCEFLCEIDAAAAEVLAAHFTDILRVRDIRDMEALPDVDLVAAGFPCADLSQAGRTAGINGHQSGLVEWVFRLIRQSQRPPEWVLLENVPFMLHLNPGAAMSFLIDQLERLGYRWAYRTIDSRAFGLPQRRRRILLLASMNEDPRPVLLSQEEQETQPQLEKGTACGFYWTEGNRGLGWAVNAIPPLKGGSGVGIPAPPAVWSPVDGTISTPDIRDAERLQGFPADWTQSAQLSEHARRHVRWRLVGNAVSVPVAEWIGERLKDTGSYDCTGDRLHSSGARWPAAGWGGGGIVYGSSRSTWPVRVKQPCLAEFLEYPTAPLSKRATLGFQRRLEASTLRVPEAFKDDLTLHIERMAELEQGLS